MTVYVIVQVEITDRKIYDRYQANFMDVFNQFEGTLLVNDEAPKLLEGDWAKNKVVVMTFPDRQVAPFSITEGAGNHRIYEIGFTESGVHRLKVNVFGKTIEGRDLRLVLPEYSFNVEHVDDSFPVDIDENKDKDLSKIVQCK